MTFIREQFMRITKKLLILLTLLIFGNNTFLSEGIAVIDYNAIF